VVNFIWFVDEKLFTVVEILMMRETNVSIHQPVLAKGTLQHLSRLLKFFQSQPW